MKDIKELAEDLRKQSAQVKILQRNIPKYIASAADKMKDANFSAQGFIENGTARRWKKRKRETQLSQGKRILHSTGILQESVKSQALSNRVTVGVDLSKVPYAKAHNEGGRIIQHVKPHHRTHYKTGKRFQVKGFTRRLNMPQRKFMGYSPDIIKITEKNLNYEFGKIFK